ncbi:DUF1311 domain-containing protein [Rhodobacteraceae bacterium D3-12]|nr:DUF1311 domain-containing protein [Rhodobacteraceae bacterium D3-12]
MKHALIALVFCAPASFAAAQDMQFSTAKLESCLGLTSDPSKEMLHCVGKAAAACMEATEGGYSTAGMVGCLDAEAQWWDRKLNQTYGEVMAAAKEMDRGKPDYAPSRVEALRAMQRAWIPYRDAKCAFARSEWGGGTGAGPAGVSCLLEETASQTLYLNASLGLG